MSLLSRAGFKEMFRKGCEVMSSFFKGPYVSALLETFFVWFFSSLVPVLILWLIGAITKIEGFNSFSGFILAWSKFFDPTEIFLYATAVLSPSLGFMVFQWRARRHVNFYNTFFIVIMLLLLATAVVYVVTKTIDDIDGGVIAGFSYGAYIVSLLIWYLVQVFEKTLSDRVDGGGGQSGDSILEKLQ